MLSMGAGFEAHPAGGRLQVSRSHGDPVVMSFSGELDIGTILIGARAMADVLGQVPPPQVVIIDLSDLRFFAVAGVRMLHAVVDHAVGQNISVRLVLGTNPLVARVFAVTGMGAVLDVYLDRVTALRAGDDSEFLRLAHQLWND